MPRKKSGWIQPPLLNQIITPTRLKNPTAKTVKTGGKKYGALHRDTPLSISRLGFRGSRSKLLRARKKVA